MGEQRDAGVNWLTKVAGMGDVTTKFHAQRFKDLCPVQQVVDNNGQRIPGTPSFDFWQERLEYNWKPKPEGQGGQMTCCFAFVDFYSKGILRMPFSVGGFNLENYLRGKGRPWAWVPSGPGKKPKPGDVYEAAGHLHVGTVLDADGKWWHVDAGQGKVNVQDIIRATKSADAFDPATVKGWIDIDLFFDASRLPVPAPKWLAGWWTLKWDGQQYFYHFGDDGLAQYSHFWPANMAKGPDKPHDKGKFTVNGNTVRVVWNTTGSVEVFTLGEGGRTMAGTYNDGEALSARRL